MADALESQQTYVDVSQIRDQKDVSAEIQTKKLLFLGPIGGTLGGAVTLFHMFLDVFATIPEISVEIIDTAPPSNNYQYKTRLINSETVNRTKGILSQYTRKIGDADAVLLFANKDFALIVGSALFSIAKARRKPFFLKTIAGDLAVGLTELRPPIKQYAIRLFRNFDGIFAETQQLQQELEQLGCDNVHYVPNCRMDLESSPHRQYENSKNGQLRLVFLSQINRKKGVFIILDALDLLNERGEQGISCDFYGPLFEGVEDEFMERLKNIPNARYFGAVPEEKALDTMARYDALVLPTYHVTEGHPGIIIEAMQVGIPVISSQLRAIPELITHGENGLLIPIKDPEALAAAMVDLASDRDKIQRMGEMNFRRRVEFSADHVINQAAKLMFPDLQI